MNSVKMLNLQNPPTTILSPNKSSSRYSPSYFNSSSSSSAASLKFHEIQTQLCFKMDAVTPPPTTLTCLDLSISIPGSSSVRDWNIKPVRVRSKRPEPELEEDINWSNINIGYPNSSEETEDIDTGSPYAAHHGRRRQGSENNKAPGKKLRLSKEQSRLLEESFRQHHTLIPRQKEELAKNLKLRPRQVEVWFQNRRARSKLKQTEIECEYLKQWFGSLTERNQRLKKEVEELRAIKVGPVSVMSAHGYEQSLNMCPRCERVSSTSTYVEKIASGPTSTAPVLDGGTNVQQ